MSFEPTPFYISIPQEKLDDIQNRVKNYPWDTITTYDPSWNPGPPPNELRPICDYWSSKYDWRETEKTINSLPHFKANVSTMDIHFIHERGSGQNPQPLLLLHGWPYSFISYTHLVPRLAHPERYGGKEEDAFTVIIPSFPGFAFSSIKEPLSPRQVAGIMNDLMTSVLGYKTYIAHGGDWGSYTSDLLGFHYPNSCIGVHIGGNSSVRHYGGAAHSGEYVKDATDAEISFAKLEHGIWQTEKAYNLIQSIRPLKLAYAMMDSPVGVAAWILEAFHVWADLRGKSLTEVFDVKILIDEVMIYLVTNTFNTATWIYAADWKDNQWTLPEGKKVEVPTGFIASPDPVFPAPPREVLEKSHRRIVRWRDVNEGGHFLFYEGPDVVVEELIEFGKVVRGLRIE
ncbi:alpha/beta-hydrolase [Lindgomyces ingoldianus]|uniref:Alpha/beta-hydrolase n=1 Tax=Lindgomyces ingoldianus TaxID=673940 RepID=A0ACB6QEA3_9PLEO|nr:alpha/beta-hydrolase [Lindgomyces ingoldianus]KAF2464830.1 alpha/beta-hydrolase [Lindgomyces ingoldianus]